MLRTVSKAEDRSDVELLTSFQQQGNQAALAILFDRYLELMYGLCLQYLKTSERAEDAVMNIYLELERKLPQHEVSNFKSWLYSLVRNFCLMQLRKEKKQPTVEFDAAFMQSGDDWHPRNEEDEEDEQEQALTDCLAQLKAQQKACVQLFYYEGYSYKAIAEMREESVGTVRSNIQNGRRNLKNCIEERQQRLD